MRRSVFLLCALMILLLSGCGAGGQEAIPEEIRARYGAMTEFAAKTAVQVELPHRTADYVIDWAYRDGVSTMTVAEPEEIAGITTRTDDQGLHFLYDGAELLVEPSGEVLSPLEALPELLFGWVGCDAEDICRDTWDEAETFAITYLMERGDSAFSQRIWFDAERLTPLYAEFYQGNALTLRLTFLTFQSQSLPHS